MKLVIKIAEERAGVFRAWCPALPGCRASAPSREEARIRIREAVEGYLASLNVALPRELGRMLDTEAACEVA